MDFSLLSSNSFSPIYSVIEYANLYVIHCLHLVKACENFVHKHLFFSCFFFFNWFRSFLHVIIVMLGSLASASSMWGCLGWSLRYTLHEVAILILTTQIHVLGNHIGGFVHICLHIFNINTLGSCSSSPFKF